MTYVIRHTSSNIRHTTYDIRQAYFMNINTNTDELNRTVKGGLEKNVVDSASITPVVTIQRLIHINMSVVFHAQVHLISIIHDDNSLM